MPYLASVCAHVHGCFVMFYQQDAILFPVAVFSPAYAFLAAFEKILRKKFCGGDVVKDIDVGGRCCLPDEDGSREIAAFADALEYAVCRMAKAVETACCMEVLLRKR